MRGTIVGSCVTCLLVVASAATAQTPAAEEARLRTRIAAHEQASAQSDLRGLVDLYAADAEMVSASGQVTRGHDAIENYYRGVIENPTTRSGRHHTHPSESIAIRFITPDVALVDVASVNVGGTDASGKALPDSRTLLTTIWRKQAGEWSVAHQRALPAIVSKDK